MKLDNYLYAPLNEARDEIRLLTLLPGPPDSPLRIKISIASIHANLQYEALSYTWGDPKTTNHVIVDGAEGTNNVIPITANLAEALEHFRLTTEERVLWIDGICINQQDLNERAFEVKLMASIYEGAHRVLVWLGPLDGDVSLALDIYDTVSRNIAVNFTTGSWEFSCTDDITDSEMDMLLCDIIRYEPHMRCLYALWRRPWFSRVWIRQEIFRSQDVCELPEMRARSYRKDRAVLFCGNRGIPWEAFSAAHYFIFLKSYEHAPTDEEGAVQQTSHGPEDIEFVRDMVRDLTVPQVSNLPRALYDASRSKCFDLRDKVYGSLGIFISPLRRAIVEGITVDYTKSVLDVYRDCALYVVQKSARLDFLKDCGSEEQIPGRPSWIPFWDKPITRKRLNTQFSMYSRTDAVWTGPATDRLKLSALFGPKIMSGYAPSIQNEGGSQGLLPTLAAIFQEISRRLRKAGDTTPIDTIVNVFTHGNNSNYVDGVLYNPYNYEYAKGCLTYLIETGGKRPILPEEAYFITKALRSCQQNRIILTENGLLGLAPRLSDDGDVIVIFPGCDVPIALRQQAGGVFTVVGECYVHGLSYGESLFGPLESSLRMHPKQLNGVDGQKWEFSACRRYGEGIALTPDPRLDWDKLKVENENAELQFDVFDSDGERGRVYATRPDVGYFQARGIPLQVIELI